MLRCRVTETHFCNYGKIHFSEPPIVRNHTYRETTTPLENNEGSKWTKFKSFFQRRKKSEDQQPILPNIEEEPRDYGQEPTPPPPILGYWFPVYIGQH